MSLTPVLKYLMIIAYSTAQIATTLLKEGILVPTIFIDVAAVLAAALLLSALAAAARAFVEPYLLDVDQTRLYVPESAPVAAAGPAPPSAVKEVLLRVAFFSDLHGKGCKVRPDKLPEALFTEPADLIVFGGDIADSGHEAEDGLWILRAIAERASRSGIPCFAVRGNHDRKVTRERIESTGFRLLMNESTEISGASGIRFLLIGLDDSGKKRRVWPDLPDRMPADIPDERRILLVHNPDYILSRKEPAGFGMMLSGHFHGGQVVLPFRLHSIIRGDRLPRQGISRGCFSKNGVNGYITRGVGCVTLPVRFLSKPQVTHLSIVG